MISVSGCVSKSWGSKFQGADHLNPLCDLPPRSMEPCEICTYNISDSVALKTCAGAQSFQFQSREKFDGCLFVFYIQVFGNLFCWKSFHVRSLIARVTPPTVTSSKEV